MQKKILNANPNVNNIVNIHKEGKQNIIDALETIEELLERIYGKNALHNMIPIVDGTAMKGVNIFTSDGINCIKQCDFESPIQNYFRDIIQYIGEHTERKAGDGTTTNMLLVTKLLLGLVFCKEDDFIGEDNYDPRKVFNREKNNNDIDDYVTKFITYVNELEDEFNNGVKDLGKFNIPLGDLIMTTAKGNENIEPLLEFFQNIPIESYEYIRRENSVVETDKVIDIDYKDYDYACYIHDFPHNLYNNMTQSYFESDQVDVLVVDTDVNDPRLLDSIYFHINQYFNQNPDNYLITLCSPNDQEKLMSIKMSLDMEQPTHKLIPLTYSSPNQFLSKRYLELNTLNLITSTKSIREHGLVETDRLDNYLLSPEKFQCDGMEMKLFGCIHTKDDYSLDIDKIDNVDRYNFLLQEINDELDYNNSHRKRSELVPKIQGLKYIKELLLTPSLPTILLGGKTHDVTSNMDMIDDIIQVTYNAKKYGIVTDGNTELLCAIDKLKELKEYGSETNTMYIFYREFYRIVKEMREITKLYDDDYLMTNYNPVQCSVQYTELFKLIREMVPRIMKTDKLIATNAVMLNNKQGGEDNNDT